MATSLLSIDPAAFKRYMNAKYSKTPANDKGEAVAEACAHLNNHALPNVYDLVVALQEVVRYAEICDPHAGTDSRIARAKRIVSELKDHLGANI